MAVSLLAHGVSDLCIGKPPVRPLALSATVGEALHSLKRCGESCLSVWAETSPPPSEKKGTGDCVGKVCMVDVVCHLCAEENLASPAAALGSPVSALLEKDSGGLVRRVERRSSILEALDVILEGAQNLLVPLRGAAGSRKKPLHSGGALDLCWLTSEDFVRFFLGCIGLFSPVPALSVESLGLVRRDDVLTVRYHEPALSAVPLIRKALARQTAVAVVTDDGKLVGEISPSTLANCDETVAAAIATLSAGELMAYVDCGEPPEEAVRAVRARLMEKGMKGMLELFEGAEEEEATAAVTDASLSSLSSGSSSPSSSSDEEEEGAPGGRRRERRRERRSGRWSGSYSARMGGRSEEAIVCHRGSSLVAVMVRALAHRVGYVWVVEEDYGLAGVVAFADVLKVFRELLQ